MKRSALPITWISTCVMIVWMGFTGPFVRSDDDEKKPPKVDEAKDPVDLLEGFFGSTPAASEKNPDAAPENPDAEMAVEPSGGESAERSDAKPSARGPSDADEGQSEAEKPIGPERSVEPKKRLKPGERIEPGDDFEASRQLALLQQRPLLVVLGADWCGWCRKLEDELLQPEANSILQTWVVVKVDVDQSPEIAQAMQASALPALRILNLSGDVVASQTGYMPVPDLKAWLDENANEADPVLQSVLFATQAPNAEEVTQLIDLLSQRSAAIRAAAATRLSDHRYLTAGAVVDRLRRGSLAGKLVAKEILVSWNAPVNSIDPWNSPTINDQTTLPLLAWLRDLPTDATAADSADSSPPDSDPDPLEIGELLRELMDASPVRRQELMQRAIAMGTPVLAEVARLEQTVDSLGDSQRESLRLIRYQILAGAAIRFSKAGLIQALSKLDGPTHFAAAEALLPELTSRDEPLIDALSTDRDPLVRELAVAALQRVGGLTTQGRMQRLLADESPTVRTAVLKQISQDPDEEITKQLVDYLQREPDESLLIYATETLGKLATSPLACDALADLIGDDRWRVRAAALDAVKQYADDNSYSWGRGSGVSEPIADAVLRRCEDPDEFVATKAKLLLPNVISKRTAEAVAELMLEDLGRARELIDSVEEYYRDQRMAPLIELCKRWLDGDAPPKQADAALLLTEISPTALRYRIDDLLQSDIVSVRVAALRAFLPCMSEFRKQSIAEELTLWRGMSSKAEQTAITDIPLIRPVPARFRAVAESERQEPSVAQESLRVAKAKPASEPGFLSEFGSFFGISSDDKGASSTEVEIANEPDIGFDEEDSSDSSLDAAASLFGSVPADDSDAKAKTDMEAKSEAKTAESNENTPLDSTRLGLPSYWMQRWRDRHPSIQRPTWTRKTQALLGPLADSEDVQERWWARAALRVCGEDVSSDDLLASIPDGMTEETACVHLLSWLPENLRAAWIEEHEFELIEDGVGPETYKTWLALTTVDSPNAADAVVRAIGETSLISDENFAGQVELLRQSLMGGLDEDVSSMIAADELKFDDSGKLAMMQTQSLHPSQSAHVQWLLDRYQDADDVYSQSVLLATLPYFSRRHATAEALAYLDDVGNKDFDKDVVLSLALSDLPVLSVDRAVALLDHQVPHIVDTSLRRLASTEDFSAAGDRYLGVPTVYSSSQRLHPLQQLKHPLDTELLQHLGESTNPKSAAIADALQLSQGNDFPLDDLLDRLGGVDNPLTLLTIALAKAKRTDDDAIEIYRRCAEATAWYESDSVRRALGSLRDDRVKQIIETHLSNSNSFLSF